MADELCVPAVAPPPVRQIKCFQLFSGDDGGASGVGSGVAAAWSFCLLGFGTDGGRIKLLVLRGDSVFSGDYFVPLRFFVDDGGVVSGQDRMRFGSFFSYAIGRKFLLPLGGLASWVVDFVGGASSLPRWEARDDDRCAPEGGCFLWELNVCLLGFLDGGVHGFRFLGCFVSCLCGCICSPVCSSGRWSRGGCGARSSSRRLMVFYRGNLAAYHCLVSAQ